MSKDNIVDFNSLKGRAEPEPSADALTGQLRNTLSGMLHGLHKSKLNDRVNAMMWDQFARMIVYMQVTNNVVTILKEQGFDPDGFMPEKRSMDRFMAMAFEGNDDKTLSDEEAFQREIACSWNGPRYDWIMADGSVVRAATTLLFCKDVMTRMSTIILKLEEDDDHWQVWDENGWDDDGLPATFFDYVDARLDEMDEEDLWEAWDDEDEDWEDEDELWSTSLDLALVTILEGEGINTLEKLASMTERDLLRIRGIGKKRLQQIREVLEEEGYSLRD